MYESIPPKGSHLQLQWHARHQPPIKVQGRCTALNPDCSTPYVLRLRSHSRYPIYPSRGQHLVTANEMYGISAKLIPYAVNFECLSYELSNLTPPPILLLRFPLIQSIVRHCEHTHAISHRLHTPWCFPESERPFHHWSHYIEANAPSRICTHARSNNRGRKNQSWAWKGPNTNCFLR